jgi:hypothetical protein
MKSQHQWIRHRRTERLALLGLRCVLAAVLSALGCGLWLAPWVAEELRRVGLGPGFARFLGAALLAGGITLLIPRLAVRAAFILGLSIAGVTVSSPEAGERASPSAIAFMALMALALLTLGAALRLRHRADAAAWHEMLARYAGREDRRRFRNA